MAKNNFDSGYRDGRNGFFAGSYDSDYLYGYYQGKQEYDYWNDKNLYPDLHSEYDQPQPTRVTTPEDYSVGFGTVFVVMFIWIFIMAPFAFFLTWENVIIQVLFWGGVGLIALLYIIALCNAAQAEKRKKK